MATELWLVIIYDRRDGVVQRAGDYYGVFRTRPRRSWMAGLTQWPEVGGGSCGNVKIEDALMLD